MAYELFDPRGQLDGWLVNCTDRAIRARVLTWFDELLEDPTSVERTPAPGYNQPVGFTWIDRTNVVVTWWIAEMTTHPTVVLRKIEDLDTLVV